MASHPPYAYVFPHRLSTPALIKMDDKDPLSKLHAKYWSKSIDEESKLVGAHGYGKLKDIGGDESELVEAQVHGKLEDVGEGTSKLVGVHDELEDIEESEVAQGCFSLELGTPGRRISKLWVRKDYVRIYDHCNEHCEKVRKAEHLSPSAIITGQPGVGKTYWIHYAVRRRLGQAEPFIWRYVNQWYLFVQGGVFECPRSIPRFPDELAAVHSSLFVIFVTSPRQSRWQPLTKNTHWNNLIMNLWTWEEMNKAADIYELTGAQRAHSQEVFLEYGPTPQLCINGVRWSSELSDHEAKLKRELYRLSLDTLLSFVHMGEGLDMELSHSIILVKRQDVNNLLKFDIEPITLSVKRRVRKQLTQVEQKEHFRRYSLFSRVKSSRILSGMIFESFAQLQLQEKLTTLALLPMEHVEAQGRANAKWRYEPSSAGAGGPSLRIQLEPTETIEYDEYEWSGLESNVFHVPMSSSQVAFDAFILVDEVFYIFQFSIAASHGIKEGIMTFFSKAMLQENLKKAEWRFVFIVPHGSKIVCPEASAAKMQPFWAKAKLFVAELDTREQEQPQDDSANVTPNEPNEPPQLVNPPPSSSRITRSPTKKSAQKHKAEDVSPEATSSKARQPRRRRLLKAAE